MSRKRLPLRDPRTVARDIPGFMDVLFPRLSGGLVAYLNRGIFSYANLAAIPDDLVAASQLQGSMLFELSVVRAERIIEEDEDISWAACLPVALARQQRHFDAKMPHDVSADDIMLADHAARNLVTAIREVADQEGVGVIQVAPRLRGFGWIGSGKVDFVVGNVLVEVKHTDRNFIAGDFRQVLMYWLLKFASSIEGGEAAWDTCILLNPRRNRALRLDFDALLKSASGGLSRVEIYELLRSVVGHDVDEMR